MIWIPFFHLADRISVLDYGKIIATGTVEEIRNNQTVKEVYLGTEIHDFIKCKKLKSMVRR